MLIQITESLRKTKVGSQYYNITFFVNMVSVVVTCGDEVSFLEFDFQNPEYPGATRNDTNHCQLTISHECDVPICQVRSVLIACYNAFRDSFFLPLSTLH